MGVYKISYFEKKKNTYLIFPSKSINGCIYNKGKACKSMFLKVEVEKTGIQFCGYSTRTPDPLVKVNSN